MRFPRLLWDVSSRALALVSDLSIEVRFMRTRYDHIGNNRPNITFSRC